jgi:hypothetical protein
MEKNSNFKKKDNKSKIIYHFELDFSDYYYNKIIEKLFEILF